MSKPRANELCEAVAALLNADLVPVVPAPFNSQFEAKYNPSPYYDLKELNVLKVDVAPTGLKRPRYIRKGRSYEFRVDVVLQKRCVSVADQTTLINVADDMLDLLLDKRFGTTQDVLVFDGELFDDELYDMAMKMQGNLFWTGCRLNLQWHP